MEAKLVQDKTRDGFRAIVQHERSNNTFYPSYPNTSQVVRVCEATHENIRPYLQQILEEFGLKNVILEDISRLVYKFRKELASLPLTDNKLIGSLACNETSTDEEFFIIISDKP